jgi:hypothetical protein
MRISHPRQVRLLLKRDKSMWAVMEISRDRNTKKTGLERKLIGVAGHHGEEISLEVFCASPACSIVLLVEQYHS